MMASLGVSVSTIRECMHAYAVYSATIGCVHDQLCMTQGYKAGFYRQVWKDFKICIPDFFSVSESTVYFSPKLVKEPKKSCPCPARKQEMD